MKVLIIHDRRPIRDEIKTTCENNLKGDPLVDMAVDLIDARERLAADFYDLVIIDLTLPVREGRAATIENAEILLEEIFDQGGLNAPADVMGISRDAEALSQISTNISQHLMTCLSEDSDWKQSLEEKLNYLTRVRSSRQLVANSSYGLDLAIITALDKEAMPYERLFELSESDEMKGCRIFSFSDKNGKIRNGILHSVGQAGQAPAAAATQALLTQFRPRLIAMTGFCGGVEERTKFGDLIGFRKVEGWDYGKWEGKKGQDPVFKPRPDPLVAPEGQIYDIVRSLEGNFEPSRKILEAVAAASGGEISSWSVKRGHAGSGSAVVTSDETMQSIVGRNEDIRAIDMESHGFYFACGHSPVRRPDYLCLKSVADMCNGEKDSRLHEACSLISASFLTDLVRTRYQFGV